MAKQMSFLDMSSWILCTIGALNWGLVGAFNWNLVDAIFGVGSMLARIIYVLVGIGGLLSLWHMFTYMKK